MSYQYKATCRAFDKDIIFYFDEEPERLNFGQVELKVMDVCPTALLYSIKERSTTELYEEKYSDPKNLDHFYKQRTEEAKKENRTEYLESNNDEDDR